MNKHYTQWTAADKRQAVLMISHLLNEAVRLPGRGALNNAISFLDHFADIVDVNAQVWGTELYDEMGIATRKLENIKANLLQVYDGNGPLLETALVASLAYYIAMLEFNYNEDYWHQQPTREFLVRIMGAIRKQEAKPMIIAYSTIRNDLAGHTAAKFQGLERIMQDFEPA